MAIGTIGKYERLEVLGHGTSGVVYLAWDTLLRRQVALKEIRAAAPEMERVLEEARVLDRLRHPNIIDVHSVDQEDGAILIDMELVRGGNLADLLRARGGEPLPLREAVRIAGAVLDALRYAHERRIIHRDVKPANIMVGTGGEIKLTDFGLAEALGSGSVAGGGGTYPYMAPEDFAGEESSDLRSDLWAVGVVLYEMLTGKRPFTVPRAKDPFAWKRAIENDEPTPVSALRPELNPALDRVLAKALAKDKRERYRTAAEFTADLRSVVGAVGAAPADDLAVTPMEEAALFPPVAAADAPAEPATIAPFRFAGGAVQARNLDELLEASLAHWNEARRALLDGRFERWLRAVGEVFIADLAVELAAAEGVEPDDRLREFLYRSGIAPNRLPSRASLARAEDEDRTVVAGRRTVLTARVRVAEPIEDEEPVEEAEEPAERPGAWWFLPAYMCCFAPVAGYMGNHNHYSNNALLVSVFTTGILSTILLILSFTVRASIVGRLLCALPLGAGVIAAGALTSTLMNRAAATLDDVILLAGVAAVVLTVLLIESATVSRTWRLWVAVVFGAALAGGALFAQY